MFSPCMAIEGQGIDVKDETMLEFLGFSGQPWAFSYRFEIGLNLLEFDDDGSFRCIGPGCGSNEFGETRIINTQIPEPTTLALIALGLAGLGFAGRRRLQS